MLDLAGQCRKIQPEIDEAIRQVIESSAFINGPAVARFAEELSAYTGAAFVIPCGNCTDALQISLMALGLKPGDEVIVPAFTYIAAVEATLLLGLKPVFVDVDPGTYNMDVTQVESLITSKTKAIIPVHLFGQSADMESLLKIAAKHNLQIIEDNAQSIGAIYSFSDGVQKQCGTMGTVGCLSFFPSKNLGCFGDGGAMLTNDPDLALRLKMTASHGQSAKYRHEIVGCNSRLDTIQAAILRVKLQYLDEYNSDRKQAARYYSEHLKDLEEHLQIPVGTPYSTQVYNQYTIQIKKGRRDAFRTYLQEKGIPTMIYYPLSVPEQPVFSLGTTCPVSASLASSVVSLPMHTELDEEQLNYITTQIKSFFT